MYAPYQVWKFSPDSSGSIVWWIFRLNKKANFKLTANGKSKIIQTEWIFYNWENETWNILDRKNSVTNTWKMIGLKELKDVWQTQFFDACFSMADIAERKPKVWVLNPKINMNPRGKPIFSGYEASKLEKIIREPGEYERESEELAGPSQFKKGDLLWIFKLNKFIQFDVGKEGATFNDNWLAYNFDRDRWESSENESKNQIKNCQRISYETLYIEWERFFDKLKSRPQYINLEDIAEDMS